MNHVWCAVRWLHVLAIAFFVGGQLFLAAVAVPALHGAGDGLMRSSPA